LFGSVVAVVFQNVFHAEMHQNNIFFYFFKLFLRLAYQNDPKYIKKLIFNKKKLKTFGSTSTTAFPKALIGLRLQILVHCFTFIYAIKSK
jgi:hypothetical protein